MREKIENWYGVFEKWRRRPIAKVAMVVCGGVLAVATPIASFVYHALGGPALLCPFSASFCGEVELSSERIWISSLDRRGLCEARFKSKPWNQVGSKEFGLGPPGGGTPELECGRIDLSDEQGLGRFLSVEPSSIRREEARIVLLSYSARYFEIARDMPLSGRVTCGVQEPQHRAYRVIPCAVGSVSSVTEPAGLQPEFQLVSNFKDQMSKSSPVLATRLLLGVEGQVWSASWPRGNYEVTVELAGAGVPVKRIRMSTNFRLD